LEFVRLWHQALNLLLEVIYLRWFNAASVEIELAELILQLMYSVLFLVALTIN
jgi:hypothetical protein